MPRSNINPFDLFGRLETETNYILSVDSLIKANIFKHKIHLDWPASEPLIVLSSKDELTLMRVIKIKFVTRGVGSSNSKILVETQLNNLSELLLPYNRIGDIYEFIENVMNVYQFLKGEYNFLLVKIEERVENLHLYQRILRLQKELGDRIPFKSFVRSSEETIVIPDINLTIRVRENNNMMNETLYNVSDFGSNTYINIMCRRETKIDALLNFIFLEIKLVEKINSYSYKTLSNIFDGSDTENVERQDLYRLCGIKNHSMGSPEQLFEIYKKANPNEDKYELIHCSIFVRKPEKFFSNDSNKVGYSLLYTNENAYYFDTEKEVIKCIPLTTKLFKALNNSSKEVSK